MPDDPLATSPIPLVSRCDPAKSNAESAIPHDYATVDQEYGSLASGGSYDVLECRRCGRRAYSPLPD